MQEQRRKAEKERKRQEAIAAAAAEKERNKLAARAAKAEEKGQTEKAEVLQEQAEQVVPTITPEETEAPKVQGVSTSYTYKAEITNIRQFCKYIAETGNFENLIEPNKGALKQLANATKGTMTIPGINFIKEEHIAVRT